MRVDDVAGNIGGPYRFSCTLRSSVSMLELESMTPCASEILESSWRMRSPSAAALDEFSSCRPRSRTATQGPPQSCPPRRQHAF